MNIMFLIFSFNVGGIERLLVDLANNMQKRGNTITLCIINDDYDDSLLSEFSSEVNIVKLGRKIGAGFPLAQMFGLAKIAKKNKIDILHCQGINCVIFSIFVKLLNPSTRIFNTVHDVGNYPSYSFGKIWLQNLILDKTIAISHVVEKEILKKIKDTHKVVTIYNAVDLDRFSFGSRIFDPKNIQIANVARFYPMKKGQDVLVKAINILKNGSHIEIKCDLAGAVFKGQQEEQEKLRKYIKENNVENCIKFLGNVDDVPALLKNIDIFVLPSRYEGFGIAMIEALASGVPVIASDIDGPKEIFELAEFDGVDIGYLAKCGDSDDFACKIHDCITDYGKYDKLRLRSFVEKHFSIDSMAKEHLRIYCS